jgi:TfoX/Sxy family transcriptional regulator of competence genes
MDAEGLKALFEPVGAVSVKRMFGGRGVYADGLCFAIQSQGEVYLKTDAKKSTPTRAPRRSCTSRAASRWPRPFGAWSRAPTTIPTS